MVKSGKRNGSVSFSFARGSADESRDRALAVAGRGDQRRDLRADRLGARRRLHRHPRDFRAAGRVHLLRGPFAGHAASRQSAWHHIRADRRWHSRRRARRSGCAAQEILEVPAGQRARQHCPAAGDRGRRLVVGVAPGRPVAAGGRDARDRDAARTVVVPLGVPAARERLGPGAADHRRGGALRAHRIRLGILRR